MRRLERLRLDAGLTVHELSEATGVKVGTIYNFESGRVRRPSVKSLAALASYFQVPPSSLLSDEPNEAAA